MTDNRKPFPLQEMLAASKAAAQTAQDSKAAVDKDKREEEFVRAHPDLPLAAAAPFPISPFTLFADFEEVVLRIENLGIDIAPTYKKWLDLGFALSGTFFEAGREFYHRLSRFYPGYDSANTDKQYNACLHSKGEGISIATFYYLAKKAGVPITDDQAKGAQVEIDLRGVTYPTTGSATLQEDDEEENEPLPTFPPAVRSNLPEILQKVLLRAQSDQDADLLLLGSITVFSACLPNIQGLYMGLTYYPNLFTFITAKASAGKGRLNLCRYLVNPIHRQLLALTKSERELFQEELAQFEAGANKGGTRPQEPPQRLLFIPADVSSTRFYQHLNENKGVGLMFETEGDTLAHSLTTEHGNYSDGLRKGFQHENISYSRRQNKEYVELERPKFSVLISGTPQQVLALIPDAENGLFSRFIFYSLKMKLEWLNPFAERDSTPLEQYFSEIGEEFHTFYQRLKSIKEPIQFQLTDSQIDAFNAYFARYQDTFNILFGEDIIASVHRLALITYRIAMILTALRIPETGNIFPKTTCSETDFQTAMQMVEVLLKHTMYIYRTLPDIPNPVKKNKRTQLWENFYRTLPENFTRQQGRDQAQSLGLNIRTAERHLDALVDIGRLLRPSRDQYQKPEKPEP